MKTTIHHDQVGFIPETPSWFNMWKEVRATHHINSIKDKSLTIVEIHTEKHLILLKTLNKLTSEGNFFNIIKESENEVAQLCLTRATPWTVACQAPLSVEFSRQEYCSGLPFPSPFMCLFASYFTCVCVKHLLKSLPPFLKLCIWDDYRFNTP